MTWSTGSGGIVWRGTATAAVFCDATGLVALVCAEATASEASRATATAAREKRRR